MLLENGKLTLIICKELYNPGSQISTKNQYIFIRLACLFLRLCQMHGKFILHFLSQFFLLIFIYFIFTNCFQNAAMSTRGAICLWYHFFRFLCCSFVCLLDKYPKLVLLDQMIVLFFLLFLLNFHVIHIKICENFPIFQHQIF